MANDLKICENRLKNVLSLDKRENPLAIINVLKSELLYVLNQYMEISNEQVNCELIVNADGIYEFKLLGFCQRLKMVRTFIEEF